MIDFITKYLSLIVLIVIIILIARETEDYVFYALIMSISLCIYYSYVYNLSLLEIRGMILIQPLLYLMAMQMILEIANEHSIFDYVALKLIHLTKGNIKRLFYTLCFISALLAGFLPTTTVVLIFGSFIIKACKIININARPFLVGIYTCILPGCLLTPFSSANILIISSEYELIFYGSFKISTRSLFILSLLWLSWSKISATVLKDTQIDDRKIKHFSNCSDMNQLSWIKSLQKEQYSHYLYHLLIAVHITFVVALLACLIVLKSNKKMSQVHEKVDWKFILYLAYLYDSRMHESVRCVWYLCKWNYFHRRKHCGWKYHPYSCIYHSDYRISCRIFLKFNDNLDYVSNLQGLVCRPSWVSGLHQSICICFDDLNCIRHELNSSRLKCHFVNERYRRKKRYNWLDIQIYILIRL